VSRQESADWTCRGHPASSPAPPPPKAKHASARTNTAPPHRAAGTPPADPPQLLDRLRELDALRGQLFHRLPKVVAHQIKLMPPRAFVRVHRHLRRRKRKDQPPSPGIHRRKSQHIAKELAQPLRLARGKHHMGRLNHGETPVARCPTASLSHIGHVLTRKLFRGVDLGREPRAPNRYNEACRKSARSFDFDPKGTPPPWRPPTPAPRPRKANQNQRLLQSRSSTTSASRSLPSTVPGPNPPTASCCAAFSRWASRSAAKISSPPTSPACPPGSPSAPANTATSRARRTSTSSSR